ncbi:hypothetical protein [Kitasatospora sp. NPDC088346]|uniref:hypothetical protein n=1 Tax=Kitasatospora sp. NPDC088346 TaxID=3364073 RepID=UPI003802DD48
MRTMIQVEFDTETMNRLISDGSLPGIMESVLGTLKPEAASFHPYAGSRAATIVVDVADPAAIVAVCEPFRLRMNAEVTLTPCMNAEDLTTGPSRIDRT